MEWKDNTVQKLKWNDEIINRSQKEQVVSKLVSKIKNGDVIAIGSGSTSFLATHAIAKKIKEENLNILAIPAAYEIELLCLNLGIQVTTLSVKKPDWGFDGADEVDSNKWLIKGRGGALLREKMLIASSGVTYILVDESKFVKNLCDKFPIPVECVPESLNLVREKLAELGADSIELRLAKGKDGPIITEKGNVILDVKFSTVGETLERDLKSIVGVVETGLFIGYNIEIL